MTDLSPGDLLSLAALSGGNGGGTSDYTALRNLPTINGTTVTGDLTGANLHLATLDSGGRVPAAQLPSYVDDVEEYASTSAFPGTGEAGKIYVALDTNIQYRWSGTQYVQIANYVAPAVEAPPMDGTAAVGSATEYARADHVHPTDTSRASTDLATQSANGLMSGADKAKLDTAYTQSSISPNTMDLDNLTAVGFYSIEYASGSKVSFHTPLDGGWYNVIVFGWPTRCTQLVTMPYSNAERHFIRYRTDTTWSAWIELFNATDRAKLDGIAAGAQVNPGTATQSANGLMSAGDKATLDAMRTLLTVNTATLDLGTLTWYYAESRFYSSAIADAAVGDPINANIICTKYTPYAPASWTFLPDNCICLAKGVISDTAYSVIIRDPQYSDATTFAGTLAGVRIAYQQA